MLKHKISVVFFCFLISAIYSQNKFSNNLIQNQTGIITHNKVERRNFNFKETANDTKAEKPQKAIMGSQGDFSNQIIFANLLRGNDNLRINNDTAIVTEKPQKAITMSQDNFTDPIIISKILMMNKDWRINNDTTSFTEEKCEKAKVAIKSK